ADARNAPRRLHRVDEAGMTARGDDDQTAILDDVAGGVLVVMQVGDDLAGPLLGGEMLGSATSAIILTGLDQRVRQHALEGAALNMPAGEGVAVEMRRLAQNGLNLGIGEVTAVEHAEEDGLILTRRLHIAVAEIGLAAGEELEVGRHLSAVLGEEPDEPAVVVKMAVAQDESVELCRVDLEQLDVAVEHFRRVAEIEQVAPRLGPAHRFEME